MCVYDKLGHFVRRTPCGDVYPMPCSLDDPVAAALEPAACPECAAFGKLAADRLSGNAGRM